MTTTLSRLRTGLAAATVAFVSFAGPAAAQSSLMQPAPPAAAPGAAAPGQKLETPTIMVVDVQKILQEATASREIQKVVDAQRDTYSKEIAAQEDKLRSAEAELRKQQTVLSADALANKRRDFEKQVQEVQRSVQARKRALETALNDAMGQVQKAMVGIIADVAQQRGANLVLARHQFVIVDTQLDTTDQILSQLNAKLPKVAVTIPKP